MRQHTILKEHWRYSHPPIKLNFLWYFVVAHINLSKFITFYSFTPTPPTLQLTEAIILHNLLILGQLLTWRLLKSIIKYFKLPFKLRSIDCPINFLFKSITVKRRYFIPIGRPPKVLSTKFWASKSRIKILDTESFQETAAFCLLQ